MSHQTRPDEPVHPAHEGAREAALSEVEALRREVERLRLLTTRDSGILQALLENSQHGILVCDPAGHIHVQSRAAERIWAGSVSTRDVEGWGQYRAFHEDGRPYAPTDWGMARALATRQKVHDREIRIQRFDDSFGWLLGSSAPFFTPEGELAGAIGVFADITSLKQSESEARRLEAALASKVAALESFARRASDLQKMMATLAATLTVGDVAAAVADHCPELFGATAAILYLLDADRKQLELVGYGGVDAKRVAPYHHIPLDGDQALAVAVRTGAPVMIGDRDELVGRWPGLARIALDGAPLTGLVALPVRDTDGPIGGIAFSFYEPPLLDAVQRDMYLTVASQCGIAIQRARTFDVAKRALEAETRANERLLQQQRRLTVLADLTETLATAFDSRRALEDLARAAVPVLADWCRIDELDEDGDIRNLAVHHRDPERSALGAMLAQRWPPAKDAPSGIARALRTGEVEFRPHVSEETLAVAARDPEHLEVLRSLGLSSYAVLPMIVRGRTLGAIMIATEGERLLTEEDVRLAEELARRAALALENTRLYEAAEASRTRLQDLFMQMPASISILSGPELRFELLNTTGQRMLGRQVLGLPVRDALPELEGQGFFEMLEHAWRSGELVRVERQPLRFSWADDHAGEERFFDFINQPLRDQDGHLDGIVNFAFDVTEQVIASQKIERLADAVARSEMRLRALVDATASIVWTATIDGRVEESSPSWLAFTGQTAEEYVGTGYFDVIHPDDREPTARVWEEARAHGTLYSVEYRLRRADGTWAHTLARALPVRDEDGNVIEYVGCNIDVTELRRAEAAAREHAETLATINRLGEVIAADLDTERVVQAVTDAVTTLTGAQFGAFFYNVLDPNGGRYMLYTISGVPREKFSQFPMPRNTAVFHPTFAGQGVVRSDDIHQDPRYGKSAPHHGMPPGHLPVRSYLAVPVASRGGEVIGGIFLGHEGIGMFDERAEALAVGLAAQAAVAMDNARLYGDAQRLIRALEATNRELDQFAYVTSHDLKAPLRGIGSLAEWIEEDLGDAITDDARSKLALLRKRVHRMEGLIQGILDFSRVGRRPGKQEEFSVGRLVTECWDLLSPPATAALTVADGMPVLVTERVALQQVFLNLMGNAVKHAGRPDLRVDVTVADTAEAWEFRVSDNGPGIPAEFHERVWGIFQILEARDKVESTGIGLAVVKKIIENKGGKTWIEESPSGGASFVFRWPKRPDGRPR